MVITPATVVLALTSVESKGPVILVRKEYCSTRSMDVPELPTVRGQMVTDCARLGTMKSVDVVEDIFSILSDYFMRWATLCKQC